MFASPVLQGQTAVVTGGGTGIGLAIARALGRLGATVAIASRNADHLQAGAEKFRCTALVRPNYAFFDRTLPRSAPQLVILLAAKRCYEDPSALASTSAAQESRRTARRARVHCCDVVRETAPGIWGMRHA